MEKRRKHERVVLTRYLPVHGGKPARTGFIADLSEGGMRVYTRKPFGKIGETVNLELHAGDLADSGSDIRFVAQTRWRRFGSDIGLYISGLEFTGLGEKALGRIREAIRRLAAA
jgi:c-di-GMP-binding flagellar brake protein YcgR